MERVEYLTIRNGLEMIINFFGERVNYLLWELDALDLLMLDGAGGRKALRDTLKNLLYFSGERFDLDYEWEHSNPDIKPLSKY